MIKSLIVRIVSAVSRVLKRNQLVASSGEYGMRHVFLLHSHYIGLMGYEVRLVHLKEGQLTTIYNLEVT